MLTAKDRNEEKGLSEEDTARESIFFELKEHNCLTRALPKQMRTIAY